MYLKAELSCNVVLSPKSLNPNEMKLKTEVSRRLLDEYATRKATEDLGYFLAVTTINTVGEGLVRPSTGEVKYHVVFNCITFKLFVGEVIEAVIHKVTSHGVFLRCGPIENVYLSANKIPGYNFVTRNGDASVFINPEKPQARFEKGGTVRCVVIGTHWRKEEEELHAVVDLPCEALAS